MVNMLIDDDINKAIMIAEEEVGLFAHLFRSYWLAGMRKKLGLFSQEPEDIKLSYDLLEWMDRVSADYTNTFRALASEMLPREKSIKIECFKTGALSGLRAWNVIQSQKNRLSV